MLIAGYNVPVGFVIIKVSLSESFLGLMLLLVPCRDWSRLSVSFVSCCRLFLSINFKSISTTSRLPFASGLLGIQCSFPWLSRFIRSAPGFTISVLLRTNFCVSGDCSQFLIISIISFVAPQW